MFAFSFTMFLNVEIIQKQKQKNFNSDKVFLPKFIPLILP